jgi:transposase
MKMKTLKNALRARLQPRPQPRPQPQWRADAFSMLLDHRFWARHPAPFNKTKPGRDRRAERKLKLKHRNVGIHQHDTLQG